RDHGSVGVRAAGRHRRRARRLRAGRQGQGESAGPQPDAVAHDAVAPQRRPFCQGEDAVTHDRPEDYERELARDRAEIGETIEAIQHRLSPGQLLDQALGYVRTNGGEAVGSVMRSARQNPWPLLLTGIGLAWLMTSTTAHV